MPDTGQSLRSEIDTAQPVSADAGNTSIRNSVITEDAVALDFAERHEDDLRYVAAWSQWFRFDGTRWVKDETIHAFDLARKICRESEW